MILLSIIIPCYNAEPYIFELLECLEKQIHNQPDVEVIIIDDCSTKPLELPSEYTWCSLHRFKHNQGAAAARNAGLDVATGQYIAFIDADDLVSDKYIQTILNKAKTDKFDYLYMSWAAFGGWNFSVKLKSVNDTFPPFNLCVWNRIYKRSMIGKVRFNTKKKVAEDAEFIRKVNEKGKKSFIPETMYYYRSNTPQSLTKRVAKGVLDMKRVVYYFPVVTKDMGYLLAEFKKADKDSEVILMTNRNDIPELANYAMVIKPQKMKGTELRGEYTPLFEKIPEPIKREVVMYTSKTFRIGGIETFIYNWVKAMSAYYDICVLYDDIDQQQLTRLSAYAEVRKNDLKQPIVCDTLILNRIIDKVPENVSYKQYVQISHALKTKEHQYTIPECDKIVFVSDLANNSFEDEGITIHNIMDSEPVNKALILVTCSRLQTGEKGYDRMIELAGALNRQKIPFKWFVFADKPIVGIDNVISIPPTIDVKPWIAAASYLVQLSSEESFGYSLVEALMLSVPVITTPIDVLPELGIKDGLNGYIIPFEGPYDKYVTKIYKEPITAFKYDFDNNGIVEQWRDLMGRGPKKKREKVIRVTVARGYKDMLLNQFVDAGTVLYMSESRAKEAKKRGLVV